MLAYVMWQAEVTDLRERVAEARRQAKADEEMMRWLNAQARMGYMKMLPSCLKRVSLRGLPIRWHACPENGLAHAGRVVDRLSQGRPFTLDM